MNATKEKVIGSGPVFGTEPLSLFGVLFCGLVLVVVCCGCDPQRHTVSDAGLTDTLVGSDTAASGDTTLPFDAPVTANHLCSSPQPLTLTKGGVIVEGDLTNAPNQFGTTITCDTSSSFDGPQRYYSVELSAWKHYRITITPRGYDGAVYAFPAAAGCGGQAIESACAGYVSDRPGKDRIETIVVSPIVDERWIVVADSYLSDQLGYFTLHVQEDTVADNSRCSQPERIALVDGKGAAAGDIDQLSNEFGRQVTCGGVTHYDGAQQYYKVALKAGTSYRLSLTPDGFDGALYAFQSSTACNGASVSSACEGYLGDGTGKNEVEHVVIIPLEDEDWTVVVDTLDHEDSGVFTLNIAEWTAPANSTCSSPQPLTMVDGVATVSGDTWPSINEFGAFISCGLSRAFDGAQLYYSVDLEGGKHYRLTTSSVSFDTALYAFPASTPCEVTALNIACDDINVSDLGEGSPDTIIISPTADQKWIIAVDSASKSKAGRFDLTVKEFVLLKHSSCAKPETLSLTNGSGQASSDTSRAINEFGYQIDCGIFGKYNAPQLYYRLSATAGNAYRVTLTPEGYDGVLYAFPGATACEGAAINYACSSHRRDRYGSGGVETIVIQAHSSQDWIIVADGYSPNSWGPFSLTVDEVALPTNTDCLSPKTIELVDSQAIVQGDTALSTNEFGYSIDCDMYGYTFDGPEVYYRVSLEGGVTYNIEMTPTEFNGTVYAFPAPTSCDAEEINAACAPYIGEYAGAGETEVVTISPTTSGDWIIVVDSWFAEDNGPFSLAIQSGP